MLLDDKFREKISKFGALRIVSIDQTHLAIQVQGAFGYLNFEYFQTSQFIEKSNVYNFGIVLMVLLIGKKPISLIKKDGDK